MRVTRRTFVLLSLAGLLAGCSDSATAPTEISLENQKWGSSLDINLSAMTKLASGVYIKDLVVGTGTVPVKPTSNISVIYLLWATKRASESRTAFISVSVPMVMRRCSGRP